MSASSLEGGLAGKLHFGRLSFPVRSSLSKRFKIALFPLWRWKSGFVTVTDGLRRGKNNQQKHQT